MKRTIALVLATIGLAACEQRSADKVQEDRKDLAEARQDANKDVSNAQNDAAKEKADAQKDADKKVYDARKDANEKVADKQNDLTADEQKLNEKSGAPMTVVGRVDKVKDDAFKIHTNTGRDLDLKFPEASKDSFMVREGNEVRASYRHSDNGSDYLDHIEVIQQVAPKTK